MLQALGLAGAHELLLFCGAVLVLNATPGVDMLLTITRTLQSGARAGVAAALGINAGCVLHTLAAAFGLAALMAVSAAAFTAVKWLGAAYLLWLAIGMWRQAWRGGGGAHTVQAAPAAGVSAGFALAARSRRHAVRAAGHAPGLDAAADLRRPARGLHRSRACLLPPRSSLPTRALRRHGWRCCWSPPARASSASTWPANARS